ncbi:MAG: hypothetical protein ACOYL6_15540 [Bacteriovoracaceae bacterium]
MNIKNNFKSPDSRFFLKTSFKLTLAPAICVLFSIYSLWLYVEMNYIFFASGGLFRDEIAKEAFYDLILGGMADYFPYIFFYISGVFLLGLALSYLVLHPFVKLSKISQAAGKNLEESLKVLSKMSNSRSIVQISKILFAYISKSPQASSEEKNEGAAGPGRDYGLYMQYFILFLVLTCLSGLGLSILAEQMYEHVLDIAISQVKFTNSNSYYLTNVKNVLEVITLVTVFINSFILIWISKGIIKEIEGVSYAFHRDVSKIVKGEHKHRIHLRKDDPGQEAAESLNELLKNTFPS